MDLLRAYLWFFDQYNEAMSASYKRDNNETLILRQRYLESTKTKKSKKNNSNSSNSATSGGGNNKMAGNNNGGAATAERRPSANNSGNYNYSIWRVNRNHQLPNLMIQKMLRWFQVRRFDF